MRRRGSIFLVVLFWGGFLLMPLGHRLAVGFGFAHGHAPTDRTTPCSAAPEACHDEAREPVETHDAEACRLCRLAALPAVLSAAPAAGLGLSVFHSAAPLPHVHAGLARYEGYSFSARAPPA